MDKSSPETEKIPSILDGTYFTITEIDKTTNKVVAKCNSCEGKHKGKLIHGGLNSTTNFKLHLMRMHPAFVEKYESHKKTKISNQKRKQIAGQSTLKNIEINHAQSKSDRCNLRYITKRLRPLSTVEEQEFRDLLLCSNPNAKIMSRQTLTRCIEDDFKKLKQQLTKLISEQEYICTTADIWSNKGMTRSFLGVTAHWITQSLERKTAVLACRRFPGTHTYDRIAELYVSILDEYKISMLKVIKCVTDNGSNFCKAFKIYQSDSENNSRALVDNFEPDKTESCQIELELEEVEFVDVDELLNDIEHEGVEVDTQFVLPPHQKCASHTLSLICVTDIEKIKSKVQTSAFAKCYGIWNRISRSTKSAEATNAICGKMLLKPCPTRWNSFYDSLSALLEQKSHLEEICLKLGLPPITETEIGFIEEYCKCLKPIALGLDRLQSEKNYFFGELIPTLLTIEKNLVTLKNGNLNYCTKLAEKLHEGLRKRFGTFLDLDSKHEDAILAAVSHPYFKLRWIPSQKVETVRNTFVEFVCKVSSQSLAQSTSKTTGEKSYQMTQSDQFFGFPSRVEISRTDFENKARLECHQYFEASDVNISMLNHFSTIRAVFVRFNTPLPTSAPVERHFSYGGMILCPKRQRLSDNHFEALSIFKANDYY